MRHKSRGSLLRESEKSGKGAWWSVLTGDIQGEPFLFRSIGRLLSHTEMVKWISD